MSDNDDELFDFEFKNQYKHEHNYQQEESDAPDIMTKMRNENKFINTQMPSDFNHKT